MSGFIRRSVLLCSVLAMLTACQTMTEQAAEPQIDELAVAELVFATHLNANQLDLAGQQLADMRDKYPEQPRIADLQQRLANAWLSAGEQALQEADIDTASAALIEAKRLLPQAPALTAGLDTAVLAVQEPQAKASVAPAQAVSKAPVVRKPSVQKSPPVKTEPPANLVPLEPEPELQIPASTPTLSKAKARIIDVNAPHSIVLLPMLETRNNHQLGRLLDAVAADVVTFRATVAIEVADTRDFHWVAALLSARVNKLDSRFKPHLVEVIRNDRAAQLVITPNKI